MAARLDQIMLLDRKDSAKQTGVKVGCIYLFSMAEVMQQRPASGSTSRREKAPEVPIPEMIEERRKDSEGRIVSNKYLRGKLLGKVCEDTRPV